MGALVSDNAQELKGRVAVVTGAGRNIGRAIALALAEGGAAVVVNTRSNRGEADAVVREIEAAGGQALACLADVADQAAVEASAAAALKRFGRIDILVNNAAIRDEKPFGELTLKDWRAVMAVILEGSFLCAQACLPALRESGAGAIVNIGGLSAHTGSRNRAHVVAAKAGVVGLTRALAHDLAADNVTVNCVSPGLIERPRDPGAPEPQHHQVNRTLSGHYGTAGDVASVVRFLCGPGARYITGQTIHANGGAFLA
jgi:3-oxoacyl-[acyl-carrier protein] reductase